MKIGKILSSFFGQLQRRHVYRVAALYGVGGWLLVQVATQVLPIFEVSALVLRLIVIVTIGGFPVALALAWVFDLTPSGVVRTDDLVVIEPKAPMPLRHAQERPPRSTA